jgi:UDP:flavonoid glycosyltransferase YjiC (YdhE family)
MKITILTYGSRGDVQPFVALARGLQNAGHIVRLAAPHRFENFVTQHKINFIPLAGDPEKMSVYLNNAGENPIGMIKSMADYVYAIAEPVARAAFAACDDADLIIHSFLFTTGAHSLARAKNIPDVSIQTFPMFAPTRAFPNVAMSNIPAGALSYFSHWMSSQIFWHFGNMGFRRLRSKAPDLVRLKLRFPFDSSNADPSPLIFAYSPSVIPRPSDWTDKHIHISGYFFLDTDPTYQPPQAQIDFLNAGDAPICVTFGSMINRDAEQIDRIVRETLIKMNRRGIILTGWGGRKQDRHDDRLLYLESAPHDWLFPRCDMIIHHGGAGTTGAGLRSGTPAIIVPHAGDQFFWAKRAFALGVGIDLGDLKQLSVERLCAGIDRADDQTLRKRALDLARVIESEDGVASAIQVIESHAAIFSKNLLDKRT